MKEFPCQLECYGRFACTCGECQENSVPTCCNGKLLAAFSKINGELSTLKTAVAKIQKQMISQKNSSKDVDGVESRLLGLFFWDAKYIHGVRTVKLWSHLLEHAKVLQYDGFHDKTESWIKKATTTFVTRTEKSIEENRIIPFS